MFGVWFCFLTICLPRKTASVSEGKPSSYRLAREQSERAGTAGCSVSSRGRLTAGCWWGWGGGERGRGPEFHFLQHRFSQSSLAKRHHSASRPSKRHMYKWKRKQGLTFKCVVWACGTSCFLTPLSQACLFSL